MPKSLKARFEAALIRFAAYVLTGRNVPRAPVVSRQDNNAMFEMGYELRKIAERIEQGYK